MLSIPIRKSEQVNLARSLEVFTLKNYDKATHEKLRPFFTNLDSCRRSFVESLEASNFESAAQSLEVYLSGLALLESRIPISSTDLKFNWTDAYLKNTQPVLNFTLEKICVAYSIAGCWSRLAVDTDLRSPTGHKAALLGFQNALNWLAICRKIAGEGLFEPRGEMSLENFQMWSDVMTAQGYMTLYDKLDKASAKKESISKLGFSVYKNFESSLAVLPSLKSFPKDQENLIKFYSAFYEASGQFYQALAEKEKAAQTGSGFGMVVARLKLAEKCVNKAAQVRGVKGNILDQGKSLLSQITQEKTSAESDNFSIYMERIPEENEVTPIENLNMIVAKEVVFKDFPEKDLILFIVPAEILGIHKEFEAFILSQFDLYKEKAEICLQNVKRSFEGKTFEGIPLNIWSQISEIQSKNCEQDVESIKSLKSFILIELKTMTDSLAKEEAEDEEARKNNAAVWTRPQSSVANQPLKKEINGLEEKLQKAHETDEKTFSEFYASKASLEMLALSKAELDKLIPEIDSSAVSEKERMAEELKYSENELVDLVNKYREAISLSNNSEELKRILDQNLNKHEVFQEINLEYSDYRDQINSEIEALIEKQERFLQFLSGVSVELRAAEFLNNIMKALDIKRALIARLDPGAEFYSKFANRVFELKAIVGEFLKKREAEKHELLARAHHKVSEPLRPQVGQPVNLGYQPGKGPANIVYQAPSNPPNQTPGPANVSNKPGAVYASQPYPAPNYSAPNTAYQSHPYTPPSYPPQGYSSAPPQPFGAPQGYPPQGNHPQNYPPQGYPPQGYPPQGYPPQGYPPQGYPPQGHPAPSHQPQGYYPPQAYPPQGYPPQGYPPQGYPPQSHQPQSYPYQSYPPGSNPNPFQSYRK